MSIRNKLIIYTFTSIFITLVIVGVSIDRVLTNLYNNSAIAELKNSYSNFRHELTSIEQDILNQTILLATDNSILSLSNLINKYQDKNNYQALIFNNDKKKVAGDLLKRITLTKPEQVILYNKQGELIAYATQNKKTNEAGFVTYRKGRPIIIKQLNSISKWTEGKLPESISYKIKPVDNEISFLTYSGKINYKLVNDKFIIENSRVIKHTSPNGITSLLGVLKVNKSLGHDFFTDASANSPAKISLLLHNGVLLNSYDNLLPIEDIEKVSSLHGSTSSSSENLILNNDYYVHSYVWPTKDGNNYLLASSSRLQLITTLNQTRGVLIIIFSIIAILAIVFGIYWLNKLISKPLNSLAEQATKSNKGQLPIFPVSTSNDEISLLGKVLNDMVYAINNREKLLLENKAQLSHTQMLAKIGGWKINHENNEVNFTDEIYNILEIAKTNNIASQELVARLVHPDDHNMVEQAHAKSMKNRTPYDVTHRLLLDNNKTKTVHVYSETQFKNDGAPLTTIGTIQDITEQADKDQQLRRSQKMDAIGKLTGGIAHDFNNMLGVILGFSELLQTQQNLTEKDNRYINEIITASKRAGKLTAKLLSFSRKESSSTESVDLNNVLTEEQIMLEKTLTVRIKLNLELADNLWQINLDKNELEDAIINMSINSMHAMPTGGELTLATKNCTLSEDDVSTLDIPKGDYVLLSITDNGSGMNQDTVQKIFEPFFTTKDEMGTGLGMSQVYGFVKRSHGTIQVFSGLGQGTRITLYFPRFIQDKHAVGIENKNEPDIDLTGSSTILIVDDEVALRELSNEILSNKGYNTFLAESAGKALEILKTEHIDLVFSDVIMPGMDGFELSRIIQSQYPDVKILMTSGYSNINNSEILQSKLYINRIQKPYTSQELLKEIKAHLVE